MPYDPDREDLYPVIIVLTETHVIWTEGENPKDAALGLEADWYEFIDNSTTMAGADAEIRAPEDWEWAHTVYADGLYYTARVGPKFADHSWTLREHEMIERLRQQRAEKQAQNP